MYGLLTSFPSLKKRITEK